MLSPSRCYNIVDGEQPMVQIQLPQSLFFVPVFFIFLDHFLEISSPSLHSITTFQIPKIQRCPMCVKTGIDLNMKRMFEVQWRWNSQQKKLMDGIQTRTNEHQFEQGCFNFNPNFNTGSEIVARIGGNQWWFKFEMGELLFCWPSFSLSKDSNYILISNLLWG